MSEVEMMNDKEEYAIEIKNVTKQYDGFTLDHISFAVPKGSIMGFIGQNGAGKTTTIKAMLNVIKIDSGSISILGKDWIENESEVKEEIAVVFDEMPFPDSFTGIAISRMFKGLYKNWNEETFFTYLERFQVPKKKRISKLSKGMKMKFQIATALSHDAKLLIMDEATTGLDPIVRSEMLDVFREYLADDERSILMSSHITSDLEKIADSITFIDKGKILLSGYKDELLDNYGILRCTKEQYQNLTRDEFVSARITEFGVDALVEDKMVAKRNHPEFMIEKTTLEEIMLFCVNREKKEWS